MNGAGCRMGAPEENHPDSLWHICLEYCVSNLQTFCDVEPQTGNYAIREGITLPTEICESIIRTSNECGYEMDDKFFHIFKNTTQTHLKRIIVRDSTISDEGLGWLMRHHPIELDISQCMSLTRKCIEDINSHGDGLQALFIGNSSSICEDVQKSDNSPLDEQGSGESRQNEPVVFNCPRVRVFSMHDFNSCLWIGSERLLAAILRPFTLLKYLDLTNCAVYVSDMQCLVERQTLYTLLLYDVPLGIISAAFQVIGSIKSLRTLDLGQGRETPVKYEDPEKHLGELMRSLPNLTRLDLSGTNLAGFEPPQSKSSRPPALRGKLMDAAEEEKWEEEEEAACSIPGLEGRYLEFLGLLGCAHEACTRSHIPARQVTGHATEEQVLLSIQTYVDKPDLLVQSLNHLFHIFRFSTCKDQRTALQAILAAMKRHPYDKHIQISGSASLFYVVKGEEKHYLSYKTKRRTITAILDGMENHTEEATMMRNGCLTLCHFKIPQDVLFEYKRMVTILLRMVAPADQEEFVQRIGIYLLNSLSCQVDGKDKQLVGDLGAISTMISIIQHRLRHGVTDEVMEIAWSTMWNVTAAKSLHACHNLRSYDSNQQKALLKDETAVNCERFLKGGGMELFLQCLARFPGKPELLRNMMGLMGNVAEVAYLRPQLRQKNYVRLFSDMLDSDSDGVDGMEVSYNACGVLAHMVSDGEECWNVEDTPRITILQSMISAIRRWSIKTKRNINYRSFEPILRLLHVFDTPECQHWAIWALCNLCTMYPDKYCPLLEKEHGLELITSLLQDARPYREIKQLGHQVVSLCERYRIDPALVDPGVDLDPGSDQEMLEGDQVIMDG